MRRCPSCGNSDWVEIESEFEDVICGRTFKAVGPAWRCSSCGEELFEDAAVGAFELAVAADLALHGPANGEAFRYLRKAVGLPAKELADLLGVTPETVSRWENGKLPLERRALALLASIVLERVEGESSTLDRLRGLLEPSRPPRVTRLKLRPV